MANTKHIELHPRTMALLKEITDNLRESGAKPAELSRDYVIALALESLAERRWRKKSTTVKEREYVAESEARREWASEAE